MEPSIDLGELIWGEEASFEIAYRNNGTEPLTIERVAVSCGCLATKHDAIVNPGETGRVRLTLASAALKPGRVEKQVSLISNDPSQPSTLVRVTARIEPLFQIEPSTETSVAYTRGSMLREVFVIKCIAPNPVRIVGVSPSESGTVARILPAEKTNDDQTTRVEVVIRPPDGGGNFKRSISLQTTHPRVQSFSLAVNGIANEFVTANPPFLYLGTLGMGSSREPLRVLTVSSRSSRFRVLGVSADHPALQAQVRQPLGDNYYEIVLRYAGGWKPGNRSGKVIVETDHPLSARLEIPYQATVVD